MELIGLIINNQSEKTLELWTNELTGLSSGKTLLWLEYAYRMEIIHKIDMNVLVNIVTQETNLPLQEQELQIIIRGNRFDVINHDIKLKKIALEGILSGNIYAIPRRRRCDSSLQILSILLHPLITNSIIYETNSDRRNESFINYIRNRFSFYDYHNKKSEGDSNDEIFLNDDVDILINKLYMNISASLNSNLFDWKNSINKWNILIENLRDVFGDKWAFKVLSSIIVGINDKNPMEEKYYSLSDTSLSLCNRAKFARSKSGDFNYWEREFNHASDFLFVYLMFFTWATPKVLTKLYDKVAIISNQLSETDIQLLSIGLSRVITKRRELSNSQSIELINFLQSRSISYEFNYLLSYRLPHKMKEDFICNQDINNNIFKEEIIKEKFGYSVNRYIKNMNDKELLNQIREQYKLFSKFDMDYEYIYNHFIRHNNENDFSNIPIDIAKDIMKDPLSYPRIIATIAEKKCRLSANENIKIVGKVASENNWFDQD
jgi:hypothetical protein